MAIFFFIFDVWFRVPPSRGSSDLLSRVQAQP